MKLFIRSIAALASLVSVHAAVVRNAPDFTWPGAGRQARSLKSLRGQAVVLIIADHPRDGAFRKQLKWLKETYGSFASKQVVFVAAFKQGEGPVQSDIPFVVASNGPAVANAYGVSGNFSLVIIGKDGNVDYQTDQVRTGERIRDVVQNSFVLQAAARK
jgi:peroxiredoxin